MKNCGMKKNVLTDYCYNELDAVKKKVVEEHLLSCRGCSSAVQGIKDVLCAVKKHKLKAIPSEILSNYTSRVKEKIKAAGVLKPSIIQMLSDMLSGTGEAFKWVLAPGRLIPAAVTIASLVFVLNVVRSNDAGIFNGVGADIAVLDQLGENTDEVFPIDDTEWLSDEIEFSDSIVVAQLDNETELDTVLEEMELLQSLGEDVSDNEDDASAEIETLDDMEIESA